MASIEEIQEEIIDEFSGFDDWIDRYAYIIELGNAVPAIDEQYKTPEYIIEGCQSRVWLTAELDENNCIIYNADSDAIIVKGIIALLIRVLSGHTPEEILKADLHFIDVIGLREHLSPTRSNGLVAMVKQMHLYAVAFDAKLKA